MLYDLKIQVIFKKQLYGGYWSKEITDDENWNEMNDNVVSHLHLVIAGEVLSSIF